MSAIDDAYAKLPPQTEDGDATPEAAALRSLFVTSSFDLLANACVADQTARDREVADKLQAHIAGNYLHAIGAHSIQPEATVEALAWRALSDAQRLELVGSCCRGCGKLSYCRCWDDS